MLQAQGYPVARLEKRVKRTLRLVSRTAPMRWQLGVTCALEHFTALMANLLLKDPRLLEGAHPAMAALWRWHAAEENEHKAVAFDVFKEIGGTYPERVVIMFFATVIFWAFVVEHQAEFMAADGIALNPKEWAALVRFLFVEPGGMGALIPEYLAYYKPGFHPWQIDNRALLEAWKKDYATNAAYRAA